MWNIVQANGSATKLMIPALMRDILEHCGSKDNEIRTAGMYTLQLLLRNSTDQRREAAAREVLSLMKQSPDQIRTWTWSPLMNAAKCLRYSCSALNTAQREECVALIAEYFQLPLNRRQQLEVISELRSFWSAQADPRRAYAATSEELSRLEKSASLHPNARRKLFYLLRR